jgi:hypothetical protein
MDSSTLKNSGPLMRPALVPATLAATLFAVAALLPACSIPVRKDTR